jgi:hypothetical protein
MFKCKFCQFDHSKSVLQYKGIWLNLTKSDNELCGICKKNYNKYYDPCNSNWMIYFGVYNIFLQNYFLNEMIIEWVSEWLIAI